METVDIVEFVEPMDPVGFIVDVDDFCGIDIIF